MAYNNTFGYYNQYQYTPQYQPANQYQPTNQPTQNNSIIWVQGEAGAKSYLVAPNTTVQLWDSEKQVIYLKSADAAGMPSMKVLDYKIRDAEAQQAPQVVEPVRDYVTRSELNEFETKINAKLAAVSRKEDQDVEPFV